MAGKSNSIDRRNTKAKTVERIAFDPFLPQQDLINEFVRNAINPDIDIGQTYYLGIVTGIINPNDTKIDVRDVFYSSSDNHERVTKALSDKKYNLERKILLVHVPSFTTNSRSPSGNNLNYDNFTKIRVEYDGKDPIQIGYLVKLQFADKNSFYDPYIIGIEKIEKNYVQQIEPAIKEYQKYQECKILNIDFPTEIGKISINNISKPAGGYIQAFEQINNVFSMSYIEAFKGTLSQNQFGDPSKIVIRGEKITVNASVYSDFVEKDYSFLLRSNTNEINPYLIIGEDILISAPNGDNIGLKNKFYEYVKLDLDSRLGFTFSFSPVEQKNIFNLDINSNFILNKPNTKLLKDYIDVSTLFRDAKTLTKNNTTSKSTEVNSSTQSIKQKNIEDKCEAQIASDKSTYQVVYTDKGQKDAIQNDINILKQFYENKLTTDDFIQTKYFYKLINEKLKTQEEVNNYLLNKNNKFYKKEGSSIISYNLDKGKINILNVNDIKNNFSQVFNFLKRLKTQVEVLEGYKNSPNDVLIVPIQVLKEKKSLINDNKTDKNSRHYYAKAFDIRIYLREPKNNDIVQIPPEIVFLYANLETVKENETIGQGIFLEKTRRYNHIEFLEKNIGLKQEEITKRLLYTGESKDELEKSIDEIPYGQTRITKLKEIVKNGANYINQTTKQLDPRFEILIQ